MSGKTNWHLLVIHLDKTNKLPDIIDLFSKIGITGCTVIESTGVGHTTFQTYDQPVIASLDRMFGPSKQYNKTIFTVVEGDELLDKAMDGVLGIVGDFCQPDMGLMYALPVTHVRGYTVDLGDDKRSCKTTD